MSTSIGPEGQGTIGHLVSPEQHDKENAYLERVVGGTVYPGPYNEGIPLRPYFPTPIQLDRKPQTPQFDLLREAIRSGEEQRSSLLPTIESTSAVESTPYIDESLRLERRQQVPFVELDRRDSPDWFVDAARVGLMPGIINQDRERQTMWASRESATESGQIQEEALIYEGTLSTFDPDVHVRVRDLDDAVEGSGSDERKLSQEELDEIRYFAKWGESDVSDLAMMDGVQLDPDLDPNDHKFKSHLPQLTNEQKARLRPRWAAIGEGVLDHAGYKAQHDLSREVHEVVIAKGDLTRVSYVNHSPDRVERAFDSAASVISRMTSNIAHALGRIKASTGSDSESGVGIGTIPAEFAPTSYTEPTDLDFT